MSRLNYVPTSGDKTAQRVVASRVSPLTRRTGLACALSPTPNTFFLAAVVGSLLVRALSAQILCDSGLAKSPKEKLGNLSFLSGFLLFLSLFLNNTLPGPESLNLRSA